MGNHTSAVRLFAIWVAAGSVLFTTGCLATGPTRANTAWLRHIKTPAVSYKPAHVARLIAELQSPELDRRAYTPAEQIAANAVHELQRGNEWDAALLLALASYRYHQQAVLAGQMGREQLPRIAPSQLGDFAELIRNEMKLFNEQDFDRELKLLREHLFGAAVASERRANYITQLARGGREDADFGQKLSDYQTRVSNRPESLSHGDLARAFQARLLVDSRDEERGSFALYYLAATPLDSFRLAALDAAARPFQPVLMHNVVPRMKTLRAPVRERLDAAHPSTRSNAAILLGMAADPDDIPALNVRLDKEVDPRVVDSLRFALARNDQPKFLDALLQRARRTRGRERDHTLMLLQWLPEESKSRFYEAMFMTIAEQASASPMSRSIALSIVGDIASERAVVQPAARGILELTGSPVELVAASAQMTLQQLQLSAAECKSFYAAYPSARASLLTRLGAVATMSDLGFLERVYRSVDADAAPNSRGGGDGGDDDESEGRNEIQTAVIQAIANIPGMASRQLLEGWLRAAAPDSGVRWVLAVVLAARTDTEQGEFAGLSQLAIATRLMVLIALDGEELAASFSRALPDLPIGDIAQLAMLSAILERGTMRGAMWRLASYDNYRFYPADAIVRRLAMSALVRITLRQRVMEPQDERPAFSPPGASVGS